MVMNQMVQLMKQLSGKISPNVYASVQQQNSASQVAFLRQLQRELKREDVLEIPLDELQVVVFDLETTGFYPDKGDKILSIGAVKMTGANPLEETFYSLVHSQDQPSEEIEQLTGIKKEELQEAPPLERVLEQFYKFIQRDTLVAHHAKHERSFMQHATWSVTRTSFQHRIVDTAFLTKIVSPEKELVTLDECCRHFGIEVKNRHHALSDAVMTAKLWGENIQHIQQLGFQHLGDVYAALAKMK
ncbi:exonuclease domain-containing protein [Alkalihalobacillus sp. LMS39]|uniref:exonuclease domain-containing protein n=1 Tax=Alkalihalobacillus sp. LMS39 TaxID=2924032 RepID=UPI001FB49AE5|nr:exonuclease domain-containing protein [Alkalihalobacillus sp. LMS39]UOE94006.1 3'-5' exoribonuclease [Alkalihalobacillus sp. LMS39]